MRFQRVFRGVYAEAALALAPPIQCHAALLVAPADAIVEGVTGLQAAGLDIGASVPVRLASTAQVRIEGINVRQVTQRVRLLVLAGLPEPAPNVWVGTDHERLAIGDMVYSTWTAGRAR